MGHAAERSSVAPLVVEQAAEGDREAFSQLVATYHHDLLRLSLVITCDEDLARDAVQAAWAHAWRKLAQLRDPRRIRSWLLSVAANESRSAMRRRRRVATVPIGLLDPPSAEVDHIRLMDLAAALTRLSADERRLIGLAYISGYSSIELAEVLRISPEGVRSRLKRIVDRLRQELHDG